MARFSWLTQQLYRTDTLEKAAARGYDDEAHRAAIVADDGRLESDAVVLTHPLNWLTEDEVEALPR